ncbi:MAG: PDZ domain-containing protein [Magnetococcales bacterium]|nr:PDZ domain-containing protein [Magnetococcales bacterium]MBF0261993.1 PDZ domain-containing protein [Magnetococcales bacterium]
MSSTRFRRVMTMTALSVLFASPALADGWLGITVQPPEGVRIGEIFKDGPADKAGLTRNDIVLKVDGKGIASTRDFLALLASAQPGREMTLLVQRKGEEKEVKITPDDSRDHPSSGPDGRVEEPRASQTTRERPRAEARQGQPPLSPEMGRPPLEGYAMPLSPDGAPPMEEMAPPTVREMPADPAEPPATVWLGVAPEMAPNGVAVARVAPGGPGERAGLKIGDQIISLNGQSIGSPWAMARVLRGFKPGDLVEMTIHRKGQLIDTQAQLAAPPSDPP